MCDMQNIHSETRLREVLKIGRGGQWEGKGEHLTLNNKDKKHFIKRGKGLSILDGLEHFLMSKAASIQALYLLFKIILPSAYTLVKIKIKKLNNSYNNHFRIYCHLQ